MHMENLGNYFDKESFFQSITCLSRFNNFSSLKMPLPPPPLFIGVDVGSESVRAGLFNAQGEMIAFGQHKISIWRETGGIAEQSSEEIWTAICSSVRQIIEGEKGELVGGIGFCGTCSMVILDGQGNPIQISPNSSGPIRDVIMWMDHRAIEQAERINACGHPILRFTGGQISPEMQIPKLLWLKENRTEGVWAKAAHFFDLADWCTWRATGSEQRSICTLTCKWTFKGHFDASFFNSIGLEEIVEENFQRIGQNVLKIGQSMPNGLSEKAANELGLKKGTKVAVGLIDAHSGALGTLGGIGIDRQMALILGTSACTMNITREQIFVPGIWGPYFGVVWPEHWLLEGGMSAFGSALIFGLKLHPYFNEFKGELEDSTLLQKLEEMAIEKAGGSLLCCSTGFAPNLHICPEFLGNRSPEADPKATGILAGIQMNGEWTNEGGLVEWMVALMVGMCCGIKEIIDALEGKLPEGIEEIVVSGGMAQKSSLLLRILADLTQKIVILPECKEPVLLGSALNAAVASGHFSTMEEGSAKMVTNRWRMAKNIEPQKSEEVSKYFERKYKAYKKLKQCERELRDLE